MRFVAVRHEQRVFLKEPQTYGTDFAVAVLGDDEFGKVGFGRRLTIIIGVAVQKGH